MPLIWPLIVSIAFSFTIPCSAQDTSVPAPTPAVSTEQMVKRINDRYDDFFRVLREREEHEQKLQGSATNERKERERAQALRMEQARQEYVKSRKARPSDEALRLRQEAADKERAANLEMMRRRYVQQRDMAEQYLKKGRQIPELKEFDLENY